MGLKSSKQACETSCINKNKVETSSTSSSDRSYAKKLRDRSNRAKADLKRKEIEAQNAQIQKQRIEAQKKKEEIDLKVLVLYGAVCKFIDSDFLVEYADGTSHTKYHYEFDPKTPYSGEICKTFVQRYRGYKGIKFSVSSKHKLYLDWSKDYDEFYEYSSSSSSSSSSSIY